jgi:type II secretory pathway component PulF
VVLAVIIMMGIVVVPAFARIFLRTESPSSPGSMISSSTRDGFSSALAVKNAVASGNPFAESPVWLSV